MQNFLLQIELSRLYLRTKLWEALIFYLGLPRQLNRILTMNTIRLLNTDTFASPWTGCACAPVFSAYLFIQDKAAAFPLRNEDETGVT